jgi:acyl-CoA synthetase (AMP-forming)/AMP-acid ligase II
MKPIVRAADLPRNYNAVDILEHNLAERPDKIALYSPEGQFTFREISNQANQVGHALKRLGVRMGDFVGILSLDVPEWAASFFGTLKIGAIAVGMNTLLKPKEYDYILQDCRARVLIIHQALLPAIEEIRPSQPFLEHIIVIGQSDHPGDLSYAEWISGEPTELETTPTQRDDFC